MNRIDGKIAVITGGSQGLGAAIARSFAEQYQKRHTSCKKY